MLFSDKTTLVPLPGVQKEVSRISKIINSELFIGDEATEENFRNNVENFDIFQCQLKAES